MPAHSLKVAVTGASGLIGTALVPALRSAGHDVVRFVRGQDSAPDARRWDGTSLAAADVADLDAVVHLAGAGVADHRWTDAYRKTVLDSRVQGTTAVARALAEGRPDAVLLSASAVGYYGDTGDRLLDETGPSGQGFLAEVCRQWEAATAPAEQAGVRVAHLRTGIVLSGQGGALKKQLPVFKAGAGAPLGSGRQYVPWISLADEVGAIVHLLSADVRGAVNLVAPGVVTNREFTKALGKAVHRPTLPVPVPGFLLKAALGAFAQEGVLTGQRLAPAVLEGSGYVFAHRTVAEGLAASLCGGGAIGRSCWCRGSGASRFPPRTSQAMDRSTIGRCCRYCCCQAGSRRARGASSARRSAQLILRCRPRLRRSCTSRPSGQPAQRAPKLAAPLGLSGTV